MDSFVLYAKQINTNKQEKSYRKGKETENKGVKSAYNVLTGVMWPVQSGKRKQVYS